MIAFIISIIVLAVSLLIISKIPPVGVIVDSPIKALLGGAIIGAFSGLWGLFPSWFQAGTAIFSLGLVPLIGGMIVFGLAAWLIDGFDLRWGFWSALMGSIALSVVSGILLWLLNVTGLVAA